MQKSLTANVIVFLSKNKQEVAILFLFILISVCSS